MASKNQTLKNAHSVPQGRTIIQRIEQQADKCRKKMEQNLVSTGNEDIPNKYRREGLCAALAILRSSSLQHEIERSNERLGIE